MKSPFRGWEQIPVDIDGVNPQQAAPVDTTPPMHILVARYVLFTGIVAFVVAPLAVPGLIFMLWRNRKYR